jgi:hypothetical protein
MSNLLRTCTSFPKIQSWDKSCLLDVSRCAKVIDRSHPHSITLAGSPSYVVLDNQRLTQMLPYSQGLADVQPKSNIRG